MRVAWQSLVPLLDTITPVNGGFSMARRGLVELGGRHIFVKIGTDDNTKRWARKEVRLYEFLRSQGYAAIPELLCANEDNSAFALEALTAEDGWDWTDTWTPERLAATLQAMDELAVLEPNPEVVESFGELALDESRDGWVKLLQDPNRQAVLLDKLRESGYTKLADSLDFGREAERSRPFVFRTDTLMHYDIRADNCAWNSQLGSVKLVDWNWTQYGDKRIELAGFLTHVQRSGLDIHSTHAGMLDPDALHWISGFWFNAAATPIWPGGPEHLRDFQLESGVTAYELTSVAK